MAELKGKMYVKKDPEIITAEFKKRIFVIDTGGEFPQKIPFELTNDKVSLIDNIAIGQEVTVQFNYKGTESKKEGTEPRYFLNLQAWKIE